MSRDLVNHKKGSWHKIDARSRKIIVKLVKTAKFAWKKATGWQILSSSIQIAPFAWRRSERLRRRLAYKPLRIFKLSYRSKVTHLRYYQFHFHFCCCTTTIFFSSARLRDTVEKSSRKSSEYKNDERESGNPIVALPSAFSNTFLHKMPNRRFLSIFRRGFQ